MSTNQIGKAIDPIIFSQHHRKSPMRCRTKGTVKISSEAKRMTLPPPTLRDEHQSALGLSSAARRKLAACAQRIVVREIRAIGVGAAHEALELGGRNRRTELIPLILVTTQCLEQVELRHGLHALGDDLEAQIVRE